jgi:hypothetical protein
VDGVAEELFLDGEEVLIEEGVHIQQLLLGIIIPYHYV